MGNLKFGPWLLEQTERQDTTGALARAWKALKEARGYNRQTTVKAITELLSSSLGEDWQALRGDESIAAAEAEWKVSGSTPPAGRIPEGVTTAEAPDGYMPVGTMLPGGSIQFDVEQTATGRLVQTPDPVPQSVPMAVLWFDGKKYELAPGKSYVLSLGPVLKEGTQAAEQAGAEPIRTQNYMAQANAVNAMLADGRTNWAALYGMADHDIPVEDDLVSLGLIDTGWAE